MSDEQKRRIEANRAAALARRNAKLQCTVPVESSRSVRLPMQHRSWGPQSDAIATNWNTSAKPSVDCRPCPEQANLFRSLQPRANKENHTLMHSVSSFSVSTQYCAGSGILNAPEKQLLNGCGTAGESMKVALEICAPDRFFLVVRSGRVHQEFLKTISSVSFLYFPSLLCNPSSIFSSTLVSSRAWTLVKLVLKLSLLSDNYVYSVVAVLFFLLTS